MFKRGMWNMSGASLDGYNTPKNGIHFKELENRVKELENKYKKVEEVITYLANSDFNNHVLPKEMEKLNEGKEKSIGYT
jgi:hypothetical protein